MIDDIRPGDIVKTDSPMSVYEQSQGSFPSTHWILISPDGRKFEFFVLSLDGPNWLRVLDADAIVYFIRRDRVTDVVHPPN